MLLLVMCASVRFIGVVFRALAFFVIERERGGERERLGVDN